MILRTTVRIFAALVLSLGLLAGCATTEEGPSAAEQAIADAKAANAKAASMGYEWRDTGKLIEEAEKALEAGDEAKALELANEALAQAEAAIAQAAAEKEKFLDRTGAEELAASMAAGAAMADDSYTVVRGDNLWNISGKSSIYGDPYQWPLIFKANRNQIKDPDLIFPGQTFDIDRNATSAEIDAAINHARTRGAWSVGDIEQSDLDFLAR